MEYGFFRIKQTHFSDKFYTQNIYIFTFQRIKITLDFSRVVFCINQFSSTERVIPVPVSLIANLLSISLLAKSDTQWHGLSDGISRLSR